MERTEIPLSKGKILTLLVASLLFVVAGLFMLTTDESASRRYSTETIKIVGAVAVIFFGWALIYSFWKLFDRKVGLIIDDEGITDNSSGIAVGFISWQEIKSIRNYKVHSTKFLLIDTINPEKYLKNQNKIRTSLMQMNIKMCGTPISISSTTLKCNFDELEELIVKAFEESRHR